MTIKINNQMSIELPSQINIGSLSQKYQTLRQLFARALVRLQVRFSGRARAQAAAVGGDKMPAIDQNALQDAIAQLPVDYRAIIVLHDVCGYHHDKVAERLGLTINASKSQLHRARLSLREQLRKNLLTANSYRQMLTA